MTEVETTVLRGYDVRVARSIEEVEELRPTWLELQGDRYTSDPDYYLTLLRSEPRVVRPHVVLLEKDGAPVGMVIGRIEQREIACRIGYRRVYSPQVQSLTVSYGGFLGSTAEESARVVVDELQAALGRREADVVYAPHVPVATALHGYAAKQTTHAEPHWQLPLPDSFESFLASKSARSRGRIRRYPKQLHAEYGDSLTVKVFTKPDEIELVFADAGAVAAKTYQQGLGVAFRDEPLQRSLIALSLEKGWFRGYVLYVEGVPIAFWLGTAYGGTFHTGPTGYDPAFAGYNPGSFLLIRMLQDMCGDGAVEVVDYGFGDAEYKHTFGSESWLEDDVLLFGRSARATRVRLARTAVLALDGLARRALGRARVVGRLKRGWRRRLASNERER